MKLNRSAVILAVAIVLLIVALFAVRSGEEAEVILLNATNLNATNATITKTTNGTLPASNATIEKQVNASQSNATRANATLEKMSNATTPAAVQTTEKPAPAKAAAETPKKETPKAEVKKQETKKTEALKTELKKPEPKKLETPKPEAKKEPSKEVKTSSVKEAPKTSKAGTSKPEATDHIKQQLNDYGAKRIVMLNAGLRPNKSNKEVNKRGNEYVARYYHVSSTSLRTEATPADSSAPFLYVGKVRYQECLYECRASTREEALNGEGVVVQQRNMLELIRYTNKWTE